jgi:hypothetical protein
VVVRLGRRCLRGPDIDGVISLVLTSTLYNATWRALERITKAKEAFWLLVGFAAQDRQQVSSAAGTAHGASELAQLGAATARSSSRLTE